MNPCLNCGACCAATRVSFHADELTSRGGLVPVGRTEPIPTPDHRAMRGTTTEPCRCVALEGQVGAQVRCAIYEQRPTICREYDFSRPGAANPHCDAARRLHGLEPLDSRSR